MKFSKKEKNYGNAAITGRCVTFYCCVFNVSVEIYTLNVFVANLCKRLHNVSVMFESHKIVRVKVYE